jgi:tRNA threonylcarbamoyladenosine biosynthesis protein TsaE
MKISISNEEVLAKVCANMVSHCQPPFVLYLQGDLGVGKTTFARYFLKALNYVGKVKSPTYTLVETYNTAKMTIHHLDLYRIHDPEELHFLGLSELLQHPAVWLIEWPEQGYNLLPPADIIMHFAFVQLGRLITLESASSKGEEFLNVFSGSDILRG